MTGALDRPATDPAPRNDPPRLPAVARLRGAHRTTDPAPGHPAVGPPGSHRRVTRRWPAQRVRREHTDGRQDPPLDAEPSAQHDARRATPPGRWRGLARLLGALACVLTAHRILLVAVPWLVLTSTGSPARAGLVTLAQILPSLAMQILTGPLLDRIDPRRVAAAGDLLCAAALLVLAARGTPPLWLLMTVMALVGAADGPAAAAMACLVPAATRAAGQPLQRGTSLQTVVERGATTLGPGLAGLLLAVAGNARTLWLVAGLFVTASLIARTVTGRAPQHLERGYLQQLLVGARFLRQEASLRALAGMYLTTNFLDETLLSMLLPVWAHTGGHDAALLGAAISTAGATATATALLSAGIGHRLPRRAAYLVSGVVSGVARFVVLAAGGTPAVVLIVYAIAGCGSGILNPITTAIQYERTPAALQARVRTLITAIAWTGIPLGGIAGAALIAATGLTPALWICGTGYLIAIAYPSAKITTSVPSGCSMARPPPGTPASVCRTLPGPNQQVPPANPVSRWVVQLRTGTGTRRIGRIQRDVVATSAQPAHDNPVRGAPGSSPTVPRPPARGPPAVRRPGLSRFPSNQSPSLLHGPTVGQWPNLTGRAHIDGLLDDRAVAAQRLLPLTPIRAPLKEVTPVDSSIDWVTGTGLLLVVGSWIDGLNEDPRFLQVLTEVTAMVHAGDQVRAADTLYTVLRAAGQAADSPVAGWLADAVIREAADTFVTALARHRSG